MAIKDDVKDAKKILDSEGQFLEGIVRSELFVKKYKNPLKVILAALVVGVVGYLFMDYMDTSKFKKANSAYNELLLNPDNEKARKTLQNSNKNLYTLYEFRNALDTNNSSKILELANVDGLDPILKDIINFQANKQSGEILSSYTAFMSGYALLKEGKVEEANKEFLKIPPNSDLSNIANSLRHYSGGLK